MTQIILNGKEVETKAQTVLELVQEYGLAGKPLAIEIGGKVVNRDEWEQREIVAGMTVEMVHFVGGG